MTDVTQILSQIDRGDSTASNELLPLVYNELRKLASVKLAQEQPGNTLQATALVHEAYLRLIGGHEERQWDSRGHFFAAAAEAMRRILVDNARRKKSRKHGGKFDRISLSGADLVEGEKDDRLLSLDEALRKLDDADPTKAELVKLRYFAGLTNAQAAEALGIGVSTAKKYWTYAKCWLQAEMSDGDRDADGRAN